MKSTLKPYHNKLKALFAQHNPPKDEPITETSEPIAACPEPVDPEIDHKALTEEVAKQVGWNVGDEVQARVSNRQMVNRHFVWADVEGWSELVKISVHDRDAWPAGSKLWCQYVKADSEGFLVFNTKERGPKWKRRGSR